MRGVVKVAWTGLLLISVDWVVAGTANLEQDRLGNAFLILPKSKFPKIEKDVTWKLQNLLRAKDVALLTSPSNSAPLKFFVFDAAQTRMLHNQLTTS